MKGADYPLEAARTLRGIAVTEAETALAAASAELAAAQEAVSAAEGAVRVDAARAAAEEDRRRQREDLPASADELLRAGRYQERRAREGAVLRERLRGVRERRDRAEEEAEDARRALAAVSADQEAVERHHAAFRKNERQLQGAREEAEAEDLAAARRHLKSE